MCACCGWQCLAHTICPNPSLPITCHQAARRRTCYWSCLLLLQAELADQSWQQQAKEAQLKENPAWPAIDRLEQQQQQLKQQIDAAQQFIQEHEEKSDYRPLKQQLEGLIDNVNSCTISLLSAV